MCLNPWRFSYALFHYYSVLLVETLPSCLLSLRILQVSRLSQYLGEYAPVLNPVTDLLNKKIVAWHFPEALPAGDTPTVAKLPSKIPP